MLKKVKGKWAYVSSSDPKKVLKYFGTKKPSEAEVAKEEKRVTFFKNGGGALLSHTK